MNYYKLSQFSLKRWVTIKLFQFCLSHSKCSGDCHHCGFGAGNNKPCGCGYDELQKKFSDYLMASRPKP